MSDTTAAHAKPPLGVGAIIGESFSILFKYFLQVIIIGFVPSLIGILISGALIGFDATLGGEPELNDASSAIAFVLTLIVDIVVYTITTALLIQLAYDAKLQRPVQLMRYFGPALSAVVPLAILSIVAAILTGLATIAFLIPGLWVYAVFSVMAPAVVIERAGFAGLGRSANLTKEYRWPIVGAIILIIICSVLINVVATFLIGLLGSAGGVFLAAILFAVLMTIGTGLGSILIALVYARLREIKEGVSVDQIAAVFD